MKILISALACTCLIGCSNDCAPRPGEEILFCDAFDGTELKVSNSARTIKYNPSRNSTWVSYDSLWEPGAGIHGCEYQTYTDPRVDYSIPSPQNYENANHTTNYVLNNGFWSDSLSLLLREEPNFKAHLPLWLSEPEGTCWMNFQAEIDGGIHKNNSQYFDYTSGWLSSSGLFKYGKFEIRAKIPNQGRVAWPAFWLYGDTKYEPNLKTVSGGLNTEIDVFEFTGYEPHLFTRNMHIEYPYNGIPDISSTNGCTDDVWVQNCPYTISLSTGKITYHYPDDSASAIGDVGEWHTYTLIWSPSKVQWFIDGIQITPTEFSNIPTNYMDLIFNIAIPEWLTAGNLEGIDAVNAGVVDGKDTSLILPAEFEIDYIKVTKLKDKEFVFEWSNAAAGKVADEVFTASHRKIVGDFIPDGKDDLLLVSNNRSALLEYKPKTLDRSNGFEWQYSAAEWVVEKRVTSNPVMHWWYSNPETDRYVVGNFDNLIGDEILAINNNSNHVHMMKYENLNYNTIYSNTNQFANWILNPNDHYVAGDFDGDGQDEILALNSSSKHAHRMKFENNNWVAKWFTDTGQIASWIYNNDDKFISDDFDGDGKDEILAINSRTKWAQMFGLNSTNTSFTHLWDNGGSGRISNWNMNVNDVFVTGDFDGGDNVELIATNIKPSVFQNSNGWQHMMVFNGDFKWVWGNNGQQRLSDPSNIFSFELSDDQKSRLLSMNHGGPYPFPKAAYLQRFDYPGEYLSFD